MVTKIEIEWTTGPNVNAFYSGKKSTIVSGSDFSVYDIENQLLQQVRNEMMIPYIQRTRTIVSNTH